MEMNEFFKNRISHDISVREQIIKSVVGGDEELEKAKSGTYSNTPENVRLGRVGQQYGQAKATANKKNNDSKDFDEKVKRAKNNERTTADMLSQLSYLEKKEIKDNFTPGSKDFADAVAKKFKLKYRV